jgi:hypothetical protein
VKDLLTKIEELERIAKINTANIKRRGSQRFHQGQVDGRSHVKSNNRARRDRGLQNGGGRSHASDFHTNGKKEICKFFRSHGRCKFGSSCRFRHVVVLSSKGDTKRKNKKVVSSNKRSKQNNNNNGNGNGKNKRSRDNSDDSGRGNSGNGNRDNNGSNRGKKRRRRG